MTRIVRITAPITALALAGFLFTAPVAAGAAPAVSSSPVRFAAAFALTVPNGGGELITSDSLATLTAPNGALTSQLDAVANKPVAIGIDPMILVSIRVLGTAAPDSATAWLDRLALVNNDTFALSYADSDITLALQAGSGTVLQPGSFDFAIDPTLFGPATDPSASPTPSDRGQTDQTTPALPNPEDLLAWDYTIADIAWPGAGTVIDSDLEAIEASGFTTTILSSANVERTQPGLAQAAMGDQAILVSDDALSRLLDAAVSAQSSQDWQESLARLSAAIRETGPDGSGGAPTALLAISRTGSPTGNSRLSETLTALGQLTGANAVRLSALDTIGAAAASVIDLPQSDARVSRTRVMLQNESADRVFSTVAENPDRITGQRRASLLSTLALNWRLLPGGWGMAVNNFLNDSQVLRNSVRVVESSAINLVADRAPLPITVSNELDQPVTVYITVRPLTPLLAVEGGRVALTIEPDSQKKGQVPVQSRSNGTVELEVSITSVTNESIGTPTYLKVNVQAGWETPITFAIAALVFAMFGAGIYRGIARRRKLLKELPE